MRTSNRMARPLALSTIASLLSFLVLPNTGLVGQDIQGVSARLTAASAKIKAEVAEEEGNASDKAFVILARWHKAKERILTQAVDAGEISEQEADFLRIEIVKAEAAETSAQPNEDSSKMTSAAQIIRSMDKDNDGKISLSEASEDLKVAFAYYDLNKNGEIDENEAKAIADYVNRERTGSNKLTAEQLIRFMDRNGDEKLSKSEASDDVLPYFEQIDVNGDGFIDVGEAEVMVR